jgi:hypothetical protein
MSLGQPLREEYRQRRFTDAALLVGENHNVHGSLLHRLRTFVLICSHSRNRWFHNRLLSPFRRIEDGSAPFYDFHVEIIEWSMKVRFDLAPAPEARLPNPRSLSIFPPNPFV